MCMTSNVKHMPSKHIPASARNFHTKCNEWSQRANAGIVAQSVDCASCRQVVRRELARKMVTLAEILDQDDIGATNEQLVLDRLQEVKAEYASWL